MHPPLQAHTYAHAQPTTHTLENPPPPPSPLPHCSVGAMQAALAAVTGVAPHHQICMVRGERGVGGVGGGG